MIHGNALHSPTYFQAVVLKGAVEVGSYLFVEIQKNVFYTIASRCTVHVIKAPTNYSDVIRGPRGVLCGLCRGLFRLF
jgi:hypothetical protein